MAILAKTLFWSAGIFLSTLVAFCVHRGASAAAVVFSAGVLLLIPPARGAINRFIRNRKTKFSTLQITATHASAAGIALFFIGVSLFPSRDESPELVTPAASAGYVSVFDGHVSVNDEVLADYIIKSDKLKEGWRIVDVELSARLDERELEKLAREIIDTSAGGGILRTGIAYKLRGAGDGLNWATSHYSNGLRVSVMGSTRSEYSELVGAKIQGDGDLIGQWMLSN